jgi:hypothetical protein
MINDPLLDRRIRGQVVIPVEHLGCVRNRFDVSLLCATVKELLVRNGNVPKRFRAVSRSSSGNLQWSAYKSNIFSRTRKISFACAVSTVYKFLVSE